jgi:hypothetical protein
VAQRYFKLGGPSIKNALANKPLKLKPSILKKIELPSLARYIERNSYRFRSVNTKPVRSAPIVQRVTKLLNVI